MSYAHQNEFTRIEGEFEDVKELLESYASAGKHAKKRLRNIDLDNINSALATANDAYALLLIATAERFLRDYLTSQNIPLSDDPKLDRLINQSRRVFNRTGPRNPIRLNDVQDMHYLREMRDAYAHGQRRSVFPSCKKVATMLGRFFDHLP